MMGHSSQWHTTEQLAQKFGVTVYALQLNFHRHKSEFVEGRDYCVLQGDRLKQFLITGVFQSPVSGQVQSTLIVDSILGENPDETKTWRKSLWAPTGIFLHSWYLHTSQAKQFRQQFLSMFANLQTSDE